jgi:MEMO1 family protein
MSYTETDSIPVLRFDLEMVPIMQEKEELIVLRDAAGYGDKMLTLRAEACFLLDMFDGTRSPVEIRDELHREVGVRLDMAQLLEFIRLLDESLFLDNERFHIVREQMDQGFMHSRIREAVLAGQSYPAEENELRTFFTELFKRDTSVLEPGVPAGVIAPHIDLQIGPEIYVPAFKQLCNAEFDTIVILGTCHYTPDDMFMLTEKDFSSPLGTIQTDTEFVRAFHRLSNDLFTKRDIAFKQEHSIEFPLLFIQHLFGNSGKKIVPILCASFDEFLSQNRHPSTSPKYATFIEAFKRAVAETGRKIVFVLSVDWSHIGKKFGDNAPAEDILPVVGITDQQHFEALEKIDYDAFFTLLQKSQNASRIDGFSCISTFLDLAAPSGGKLLAYQQWHEEERASGVTFASMVFTK